MARRRRNPAQLDSNAVLLIGGGTILLAAIVYGIYEISQGIDAINATNQQIAQSTETAQGIVNQASASASEVSGSINQASQTVQSAQQNPSVIAANSLAQWWNSL